MTSWCVVNPTTYIVADDAGKVFMTTNAGVSWTDGAVTEDDALVTSLKFFADPTLGTVILAGTADSDGICKAFISTNNCTSFTQIGTPIGTITAKGPTPLVQVGFDNLFSTNHIVYAAFGGEFDHWITTADTTGANSWIKANQYDAGIVRSTVSIADPTSSTLWKKIVSQSDFSGMLPAINGSAGTDNTTRYLFTTGLAVGPQDTLYVTLGCYDSAQDAIVCGGFIRCLDGTVATPKFDFTDSNLLGYGALWTANVVPGSSNLFTIGAALGNDGNLHLRLLNYIDTLASKAGSMVPVSGATAQGTISGGLVNVPLSWGGISGTSYKWQVALDSNFDSIVKEGTATTAAAIVSGLQTGTPYYWRVKVTAPAEGPWSAAASFTTASTVSGAPQLISPANGDTISDTKPLFAWNPVAGATSYNIKVATDATFTAITEQATVNTNSYATPTKLADGVYYWEVTATVGSTTTAPGNSVFQINSSTTSNAPQSWVWVLIALGVVLAIFVLVLILRTRRPV